MGDEAYAGYVRETPKPKRKKAVYVGCTIGVILILFVLGIVFHGISALRQHEIEMGFEEMTHDDAIILGKVCIDVKLPLADRSFNPDSDVARLSSLHSGLYRCFVYKDKGDLKGVVLNEQLDVISSFYYQDVPAN